MIFPSRVILSAFFLLCLLSGKIYGQCIERYHVLNRADSLFKICEKTILADQHSVIALCSQVLTISTYGKYQTKMALSNYYLGKAYRLLEDYKKSMVYEKNGLLLYKHLNDNAGQSLCLKEIGLLHGLSGDVDKELNCYTKALSLAPKNNSLEIVAALNNNIGTIYYDKGKYDKAILHYNDALSIVKDDNLKATLLSNLGHAYNGKGMYNEALKFQKQSLALCNDAEDVTCRITALNMMASIYWDQGKDQQVLDVAFSLLPLLQIAGLTSDRIEVYNKMGLAYRYLNKLQKSIAYHHKALDLAMKSNYQNFHYILANLAFAYQRAGKYKLAYEYFVKHKNIQDSIENLQSNKEMENLLAKYEANKKEQKIILLQQEKQLQTFRLQKQKDELKRETSIRNWTIIGAILQLIPAYILLIFYRQKIKNKALLAAKTEEINRQKTLDLIRDHEINAIKSNLEGRDKERERISRELHDGVAGSLAAIKLHIAKVAEQYSLSSNLNHVIQNIDNVYDEVRIISHNLVHHKILNPAFIDLIRNQLQQLAQSSSIELDFICFPERELNQLPNVFKIEMYRIIQELTTNIIKHAEARSIEIQFTKADDYINLIVEDNGKGFDPKKVAWGVGLNSIKTRVNHISGSLHIDSAKGRGTIVNIDIPVSISLIHQN